MKKISQIISAVFSPLLVPTYAVALSLFLTVLALVPAPVKWTVTGVCFAITCLVPLVAIILLHKLGVVKDPGLNDRNERLIPYAVSALSYCACAIYLRSAQAPGWLWLFMAGATLATVICAVVNRWWKISAHLTAMGGLMAIAFRILDLRLEGPGVNFFIVAMAAVIATGLVGTSRIYLGRHTLWQVMAGAANGFLCVSLVSLL